MVWFAWSQESLDIEEKMLEFLEEYCRSHDQETTFQLLSAHGHSAALLKYASLIEDTNAKYERMVSHHMAHRRFADALEVLEAAPFEKASILPSILTSISPASHKSPRR